MSTLSSSTTEKGAGATPPSEPAAGTGVRRLRKPVRAYLEAYAFPGLLVLALVFFSVWPKTSAVFPTTANLQILFGSNTVVAIVALGALIPLVCNEWDLSIGATAALSSVYAVKALSSGTSLTVALLLAVGVGLLVGITNALLVTRLGVNAVITTLGISIIIAGV